MNPQTTARSAPGPNEIIRFEHGTIETVNLQTTPATAYKTDGNYGPQWQYFCRDRRMFYADEKLHAALTAAAVHFRVDQQLVDILKTRQGSRNVYTVTQASDTTEDEPQNWDDLPALPAVQQKQQPPLRRATADQTTAAIRPPTAQTIAAVQAQARPEGTSLKTAAAKLLQKYMEALDVAALAQQEAKTKGILISPSFEDLRCIAATLFIEERKGA